MRSNRGNKVRSRAPKAAKPPAKPVKQWESFERAVASVQQLFSPDAEVTHNEKISDTHNRRRQFDVVIRGEWAGRKLLGVIECRDKKRPADLPQIDAFIAKSQSVRANFALVVSRAGFSKEAITLAREHGIGTLSLLPGEHADAGFVVGFQSYARFFEWTRLDITIQFKGKVVLDAPLDIQSITYQERSVADWFKKKLCTGQLYRKGDWLAYVRC